MTVEFELHAEVTVESPAPHAGQIGVVDRIDADYAIPLYHVLGIGFEDWYAGSHLSARVPVGSGVSA